MGRARAPAAEGGKRRVADRLATRGRGGAQAGRPRLALDIQLIEISAELKYFDALKNPILNIATITSALGIGAGVIGSVLYAGYISEQRDIMINADNQNITPTQRSFLLNEIDLITVNSINSFNSNVSNLSISQGFVNCNFTMQFSKVIRFTKMMISVYFNIYLCSLNKNYIRS